MIKPVFMAVTLAVTLAVSTMVMTSHHFESILSQGNPALDLTDVYVFPSERDGYTVFIVNMHPDVEPGVDSPFDDEGLYNLHIVQDESLSEGITLTLQFTGSEGRVGLIEGANEGIGSRGTQVGQLNIGQTTEFANGLKIWTGMTRDPFMGNCAGLARQHISVAYGILDRTVYDDKVDFFEYRTVGAIVVEVPNAMLGENIFVYATTAKQILGNWNQINRMANPLLTHLFMHFDVQNTLEHVHHRPDTDDMRSSTIAGHTLRMITMTETKKENAIAYVDSIVEKLLPDLIGYTVGKTASYAAGTMGGRAIADDVMDAQLSLFWGEKITDGANDNADRHQKRFPYIIPLSDLPDGKPPKWEERPDCNP